MMLFAFNWRISNTIERKFQLIHLKNIKINCGKYCAVIKTILETVSVSPYTYLLDQCLFEKDHKTYEVRKPERLCVKHHHPRVACGTTPTKEGGKQYPPKGEQNGCTIIFTLPHCTKHMTLIEFHIMLLKWRRIFISLESTKSKKIIVCFWKQIGVHSIKVYLIEFFVEKETFFGWFNQFYIELNWNEKNWVTQITSNQTKTKKTLMDLLYNQKSLKLPFNYFRLN